MPQAIFSNQRAVQVNIVQGSYFFLRNGAGIPMSVRLPSAPPEANCVYARSTNQLWSVWDSVHRAGWQSLRAGSRPARSYTIPTKTSGSSEIVWQLVLRVFMELQVSRTILRLVVCFPGIAQTTVLLDVSQLFVDFIQYSLISAKV